MKKMILSEQQLDRILRSIQTARLLVIGDICLDLYWYADMRRSRLSRETPHFPLPVVSEKASPGGGSNVMNNLHALHPGMLRCISVLGDDWRGWLLRRTLEENGISTEDMMVSHAFLTPCYGKPMRKGISDVVYEDPRLDFENADPLSQADEKHLIRKLREAAQDADAVVVCDQFRNGVVTPAVRQELEGLAVSGKTVIVDSREQIGQYKGVIVKPNEVEAAAALGLDADTIEVTPTRYESLAAALSRKNGAPALVTLGSQGALWASDGMVTYAPAWRTEPPLDIVGAGDTFLSALAAALAAGIPGDVAAAFANLASAVTIRKIGTTGTASPEEITARFREG